MGSTRLPGKVLMSLGRRRVLPLIIERLGRARVDQVVVATSTLPRDDAVAATAEAMGIPAVRGPEDDVLRRFGLALEQYPSDEVVRLTADNPFVDSRLVDLVVDRRRAAGADYCSNTLIRTFPDGLDVEVMTAAALTMADLEATDSFEREHVTPYIYRRPRDFSIVQVLSDDPSLALERWTLDDSDDLARLRAVEAQLEDPTVSAWQSVLEAAGRHADLHGVRVVENPAAGGDLGRRLVIVLLEGRPVGDARVEVTAGTARVTLHVPTELADGAIASIAQMLGGIAATVELDEPGIDDPGSNPTLDAPPSYRHAGRTVR
jgi:spore coat polysaccharide biosynthesis protein SpsF (cytidylyltransferase family)